MMLLAVKIGITGLFSLMGVRAFQSGTGMDRLLGAFLLAGLLMLFLAAEMVAVGWLLLGAAWYLVSQVLTSARLVSRALPVLAGALVALFCYL